AGRQSDLYSLGCVLFEMLTGSPPFPADTIMTAMSAHAFGEPPRASERAPWLASSLDGVIVRALQKDPTRRQVSVMDFAKASRVALGGAEFFRHYPDPQPRPGRWGKRSRRPMKVVRRREQSAARATEPGTTIWTRSSPAGSARPGGSWAGASWASGPTRVSPQRKVVLTGAAIATAVVLLVSAVVVAVSINRESTASSAPSASAPSATVAPQAAPGQPAQPGGAVSTALPRMVGQLAVPGRPETVAVSPDGRFAYMTSSDARPDGTVSTIDTATNQVVETTPIPGLPRFVAVNPVTGNVYVSYNNDATNKLEVAGIDAATRRVVKTIDTGQPADRKYGQTWLFVFAISNDGKRIYIPHHNKATVSVLDTDRNTAIAQIPMPMNPHSVALTPDGRSALVATHASGEVDIIDTTTNTFTKAIPIGPGLAPHDVAVSPDGRTAHVVNFDGGTVSVIDIPTATVRATIAVRGNPQSVVFARDGRRSYVVDNKANQLHTIDATTNTITGTVPVPAGASMVALSPDGTRAYIASRDAGTITTLLTAA
ncbi:MAG: beta-propeller fold lactonase family protein, partial [Williamsia herbipolensis]|nr:beta-propeller fold lactonase family protein [Williamsia herbipolensis]